MHLTYAPLVLMFAMTGFAQTPQFVQQATNSGALASSIAVTLPQLPASGNLLVVCHDSTSSGISVITGGGVTNWILCQTTVPTRDNSAIYAGLVDAAPSTSILLTLGGSPNDPAAVVTEWRGFRAPLEFAGAFTSGIGGTAGLPAASGSVSRTGCRRSSTPTAT